MAVQFSKIPQSSDRAGNPNAIMRATGYEPQRPPKNPHTKQAQIPKNWEAAIKAIMQKYKLTREEVQALPCYTDGNPITHLFRVIDEEWGMDLKFPNVDEAEESDISAGLWRGCLEHL